MPVRVLSLINNRVKGYAVRQGLLAARGEFRLFTDVDLARYGFDEVLRLAKALWAGKQVAIASRCHADSEMVLPSRLVGYLFRRHLQSEVFGALARRLLPITQRDTQAGLKGMSFAQVAERIAPRLRCNGFGFDCEMLTACSRLGIAVEESALCACTIATGASIDGLADGAGHDRRFVPHSPRLAARRARTAAPGHDRAGVHRSIRSWSDAGGLRSDVGRLSQAVRVDSDGLRNPSYGNPRAENWRRMALDRYLIVTADDFGIGPATTRGILELVDAGVVTASVLLVNSPHAEASVRAWRASGRRFELGWHPCLTIDRPVLPKEKVPSLVDAEGKFLPLAKLMRKLLMGGIRRGEVEDEFRAQYDRFREMTQSEPPVVNTHHHIQVFGLIGSSLRAVLERQLPRPYVRRICESWRTLAGISGGRLKRLFLNQLGRSESRRQAAAGYPGNDWLGGITDPHCVKDPEFFRRWLRATRRQVRRIDVSPGVTWIPRWCAATARSRTGRSIGGRENGNC